MTDGLLTINEAAEMLCMTPEGLRVKLRKKQIPSRKVGRRWIIIHDDLVEFIRSGYSKPAETSWGVNVTERRNICHSTKEARSGGLTSLTVEREYNKLLEQRIGS